jgi:hypothetical protein
MATAARRSVISWSGENCPIYPPGFCGGGTDVVTLPSDQNNTIELQAVAGGMIFGHSTRSRSFGSNHLTDYFVNVLQSMEGLVEPYGIASGEDPFEYRSVPYQQGRTVRAKVEWIGPIPPSPIDDD